MLFPNYLANFDFGPSRFLCDGPQSKLGKNMGNQAKLKRSLII